jgi:hypothetical protein
MTEIVFNQDPKNSTVKILIATFEEQLNYGITGSIIDRSTFNKLKTLTERETEKKSPIITLDMVKEVVVLLRTPNLSTDVYIQNLGAKAYQRIKDFSSATVYARHLPKTDFSTTDIVNNLGLGIDLASYSFDKYFTTKKDSDFPKLETINFVAKEKLDKKSYEQTKALTNAVRYARDLTNEPSNNLTPEIYTADIKRLENLGLKITVLNKETLKKKGFNMLLSVSQGSCNDPYVCILEYKGNKKKEGYDNLYYVPLKYSEKINLWLDNKLFLYNNAYGSKWQQLFYDIKELVETQGVQLVIVDNLAALSIEGYDGDKYAKQTQFVIDIKEFAKQKNIHVILVCHPRKRNDFLRKESISGTADLTNIADNVFLLHRVGKDFETRAGDFFGKDKAEEYMQFGNVLEVAKNRQFGIVDHLVGMYYEQESRRLKNTIAEHIVYGWDEQPNVYQPKEESQSTMPFNPFEDVACPF